MASLQNSVTQALAIRDEVTKTIRSIGKRGYNGEKVDVESAQEIAEKLISLAYIDLESVADALAPVDEEN